MKEAFTVIASAWSTAFIVLFFAFAIAAPPGATDDATARAYVILFLFVGAVTGAGWLWFRRGFKKRQRQRGRIAI